MTEPALTPSPSLVASRRFLPLLLLLFAGSGCSALIYEIVWFQLLQLVIGSSGVSLGVLLGTFMGGMCLGSLALPRLVAARRHPLRVYAVLELGLGMLGILVLFGMPYISHLYTTHVGPGLSGLLLRGGVCALCLLPPTLLMGATLPAMSRWVDTTPQGISWLGFFYGGNIAGAVFGCLLAGFYLLRVHDVVFATYVAAGINVFVALGNLGLAALAPHRETVSDPADSKTTGAVGAWPIYVTIALSGLCALGAEVVWTRLLSLMIGGTVYTFSIILAVFLVGLGMGSSVGSVLSGKTKRPRLALGICQMLLVTAIAWTAWMLAKSLPFWPINPSLSTSPWFDFQLDLLRCAWAILPAACLWGASFPLALAAAAGPGQDPARLVGGVYAANTVGAILGAIGFSVLLIGWVGTQHAEQALIGLAALAALVVLVPSVWASGNVITPGTVLKRWGRRLAGAGALLAATGLAGLLAWTVAQVPWGMVAYGRYSQVQTGRADVLYMGEGMNSSIAVSELENGTRNFHVSGKIEASSESQDMRLQRMLGHIPALLHAQPRSVLIVGCGAGVTAGSFVLYPDIQRIVICELEPLIPPVAAKYFRQENYGVVTDRRVRVVFDDARHFILTTPEKFDVITSDPIHPWVKGSATLYSKEYFELCKRHLNPGGVITQWVPLYESNLAAVKSELATFFEVFPDGTIWSNDINGEGYDVVLLGQAEAMKINVDELQQRLERTDFARVAQSLNEVGFDSAVDLLATYAGRGSDLGPWLRGAEINRDRNLRLQYLAGMGLDLNRGAMIYNGILAYRQFPEELFVASDGRREKLKKAFKSKR